jgi:hydrogenase nickel insertion protein HypA
MHEFALVQKIFQKCLAVAHKNNAEKIMEITLELGDFSLVIEDMLSRSFNMIKKNSIAGEAELVMTRTPGIVLCADCEKESELWFAQEKKNEEELGKNDLKEFESTLSANDVMSGNMAFGRNLFQCKHCRSNNTDLIKGKSILIKNIRVF